VTTIAWDGRQLAGDRLGNSGGVPIELGKIWDIEGEFVGIAGLYEDGMAFVEWLLAGEDPASKPEVDESFRALVVRESGKCFRYESKLYPFEILEPYHALGSGRDFALAALHYGKSAKEAVELAMKFDLDTGIGVDVLTVEFDKQA
jgi:hypothetical protein